MRIQYKSSGASTFLVHTAACTVTKITGWKAGGANAWLLVFDSKTPPAAASDAFKKQIPLFTDAPFGESYLDRPIVLSEGCYLVVSSSPVQYTALAQNIEVELDGDTPWDNVGLGLLNAGDYTTGAASLDVAVSNAKLHRLEFTSLSDAGADLYAKIFPTEFPDVGDKPLHEMVLRQNTSEDFFFFDKLFYSREALGTPVSTFAIIIDELSGVYDGNYAGTDYAIKATYRP